MGMTHGSKRLAPRSSPGPEILVRRAGRKRSASPADRREGRASREVRDLRAGEPIATHPGWTAVEPLPEAVRVREIRIVACTVPGSVTRGGVRGGGVETVIRARGTAAEGLNEERRE